MKVIITGDVHERFGYLNKVINKRKPDIVICCGDFGYWPPLMFNSTRPKPQGSKIYWVDGNHENFNELGLLIENRSSKNEFEPIEWLPDVYYMNRGSVLEIGDKRVLFVGGARSYDKEYRTEGIDWFPNEVLTEEQFEKFPDVDVDVVISHTMPRTMMPVYGVEKRKEDPSWRILDKVFLKYVPKEWYFGHWHFHHILEHVDCKWTALAGAPDDGWWIENEW